MPGHTVLERKVEGQMLNLALDMEIIFKFYYFHITQLKLGLCLDQNEKVQIEHLHMN